MEESKLRKRIVFGVFATALIVTIVWSIIGELDRRNSTVPPGPISEPAQPFEIARALDIDAESLAPLPTDPPAPAGDLKAEADRFVSLDTCVDERARLDPLVGDSLRAIGYDTFLRDSCRTLEALHAKTNKPCAAIESTPLRHHCESTVAIALGQPDDCPFGAESAKDEGRDAACVAIAARDARLCAAVASERARCEAVIARSARLCPRSHDEGDACRRDVERLRSLMPEDAAHEKPFPRAHLLVTVKGADGTDDPVPSDVDDTIDVARGVTLVIARDRRLVDVGRLGRSEFAPPGSDLRVALRAADVAGRGVLEQFELVIPSAATVLFPGNRVEGTLKFDPYDAKRGAPLGLSFEGHTSIGSRSYTIKIRIDTFVRDVVKDDERSKLREQLPASGSANDY